jgi:hypothetical protein
MPSRQRRMCLAINNSNPFWSKERPHQLPDHGNKICLLMRLSCAAFQHEPLSMWSLNLAMSKVGCFVLGVALLICG